MGHMAWTEALPSGRYRACWRDHQGRKRSKSGFTQDAAALRFAGQQELNSRTGMQSYDGRAPTWETWRDEWLKLRTTEASTALQDKVRIDRYLTPQWGNQRINRITRSDVQAWVNELTQTKAHRSVAKKPKKDAPPVFERMLAPATVDRIYRLFSSSMKQAVLHGRIAVSPCAGIKLPPVAPGHERYLTRVEVDLILFHLNAPYKQAATLLVATGMRFGELAGLHWQRVDYGQKTIDIVETWDAASGTIKGYPKGRGRRTVPVPSWAWTVLDELLDGQFDEGTSCGLLHAATTRCRSRLVVPAARGGALDAHNVGRRDWADAVKLAGVGPTRLHDLRHTYASWLVQDGVPLQEVQRLLGHASILQTQRYAHLGTSQNASVLAALENRG